MAEDTSADGYYNEGDVKEEELDLSFLDDNEEK